MPTIPLLTAPVPENSGGGFQRAGAQLVDPVRANPNMLSGQAEAAAHIGQAMQEVGNAITDVQARAKQATDSAYIVSSHSKLEQAYKEHETYRVDHPDPSTWAEDLDFRLANVKADINEGAKQLSPLAKQHLTGTIDNWQRQAFGQTAKDAALQSISIAKGAYNESIDLATDDNNLPAVKERVDEAVRNGVYHSAEGTAKLSRAQHQIGMNVVNGLIEQDPFEAEKRLKEQDATGAHTLLADMPEAQRVTLEFRAHKAAAQTRSNTMRQWASDMKDALNGDGPMPDRAGIDEEAAHQGISPKWVANLFKAPTATDPHEFASAYNAVSGYDETQDPTHEKLADLVGQIEGFRGIAKEKLDKLLGEKIKADDVAKAAGVKASAKLTTEVTKFGETSLKDMFTIGGYGQYKETIKNPGYAKGDGPEYKTIINPAHKQAAELVYAQNLTLFHDWVKQHPQGTPEEAQKFINGLNAKHATNGASKLIINSGAFGFPK